MERLCSAYLVGLAIYGWRRKRRLLVHVISPAARELREVIAKFVNFSTRVVVTP